MCLRTATGGYVLAIFIVLMASFAAAAEPEAGVTKSQLQSYLDSKILGQDCPAVSDEEIKNVKLADRTFPDEAQQLLIAWLDFSGWRRNTYYVFSVGIILFGALASALKDGDLWWRKWKTAAALSVTLFGGLNSTLAPYAEHKTFDQAFVVLNATKMAYFTNPKVSLCDIGKAVAYAESIIHRGD